MQSYRLCIMIIYISNEERSEYPAQPSHPKLVVCGASTDTISELTSSLWEEGTGRALVKTREYKEEVA